MIYLVAGLAAVVVVIMLRPRHDAAPTPVGFSPNPLRSVDDDSLSWEYATRVKAKADVMRTREVLESIHSSALGQFTPIPSHLPPDPKPHPASVVPDSPKA